jgi:polyferredoxin
VNGWGVGADTPAAELRTLRKTNLTTLVVWGLWWPGMIAAALVLGRAWCTVCPMELVNRIGDALGKRLPIARLPLGRALRAGWVVVAAYLCLQLLVAGASVHRVPHYTALLLLALLGTALAAGLVFREPRSFCKGSARRARSSPVYGRFTPVSST